MNNNLNGKFIQYHCGCCRALRLRIGDQTLDILIEGYDMEYPITFSPMDNSRKIQDAAEMDPQDARALLNKLAQYVHYGVRYQFLKGQFKQMMEA